MSAAVEVKWEIRAQDPPARNSALEARSRTAMRRAATPNSAPVSASAAMMSR
jgi:hypothetical protein